MLEKCRHRPGVSPLLPRAVLLASCVLLWRLVLLTHREDSYTDTPMYRPIQHSNDSSLNLPMLYAELTNTDFSTLINLHDFEFLLNNFPCNKTTEAPLLLVLIHSAPHNFIKRNTIRTTWGKVHHLVKLTFFLGNVDNDELQNRISMENNAYSDIVQGNFFDHYRNLTYKHVMALKWATYFCLNAKYILKSDDDVFVNMPSFLNFLLSDISPLGARKLVMCSPAFGTAVKRSFRSKWRVSPIEYSDKIYPTYCPGWVVLYSPDVVVALYQQAQRAKYFWIDDVHITGTLVAQINVTHSSFRSMVLTEKQLKSILNDPSSLKTFLFGPPNLSTTTIESLWKTVNGRSLNIV